MPPLFSKDMLRRWWEQQWRLQPPPVEEIELPAIDEVLAIRPQSMNAAFVLRMHLRNGKHATVILNPVLAKHLATSIILMGQEVGWLDKNADVVVPDKPPLDS